MAVTTYYNYEKVRRMMGTGILSHFLKYLWKSKIPLVSIILPIVKSFKILPKHNEYGFIFESFALNLYIQL